MEMHINNKIVEIWLTRAERDDPILRKELKAVCTEYGRKYTVAIFESGNGDLYLNTLDLLRHNRQLSAEEAVLRSKTASSNQN